MNENTITIYCPSCGFKFNYTHFKNGKVVGGIGGVVSGAIIGSKIGIAMGPLGAIAGTIPGALLGGFFGKNIGGNYDKPQCPKCGQHFKAPSSQYEKETDTLNFVYKKEIIFTIPNEIKELINDDDFFSIADKLVLLEIKGENELVFRVLKEIKIKHPLLFEKVNEIRNEMRKQNNLF